MPPIIMWNLLYCRYESPYWRSLAAIRIQVAWRYRKKRLNRADTAHSNNSSRVWFHLLYHVYARFYVTPCRSWPSYEAINFDLLLQSCNDLVMVYVCSNVANGACPTLESRYLATNAKKVIFATIHYLLGRD